LLWDEASRSISSPKGAPLELGEHSLQEERTDWLTFVARYRDGSLDRFAVDPFTVLIDNYVAGNDARKRQEEGSLKLGEIVLVYRDRRLLSL
jgi:hypothetical protein